MSDNIEILRKIHSSDRSTILLVKEKDSDKQYLLKQNNTPTDARIFNEVELFKEGTKDTDSRVIQYEGKTAFIRPYYEGKSLSSYIKEHTFSLFEFLEIAISLCDELDILHKKGIIHKDINPSNIIINPANHEVHIIDLEHGTLLNNQVVAHGLITYIEGTLAYIPPEQTGRTGRKVDYRSDYYSLGASLYELLTGKRLYKTDDPLELIHCHLAIMADSPTSIIPTIPTTVSNIVLKLLAKNAEQRYQTIDSLKQDLINCLNQLNAKNSISSFVLGEKDAYGTYAPLLKTYGRNDELKEFKRIVQLKDPERNLVFLKGPSGSGKSLLINDFDNLAHNLGIKTYLANYNASQENKPYSGWIGLLNAFCDRVEALDAGTKKLWTEALKSSLKGLEKELISLLPSFGRLIDYSESNTSENEEVDGRSRILLAWNKFFECILTINPSITIFLDDLQWADEGSITLIESLLYNHNIHRLTIVAAYRGNGLESKSALLHLEKTAKNENKEFGSNVIELDNLNEVHIEEYLVDSFIGKGDFRKLAKLIHEKTFGLPIAISRFCENLNKSNLVKWNANTEKWSYNLDEIKVLSISKKVAEIILSKLNLTNDEELYVLKAAASCGKMFKLSELQVLTKQGSAALHRKLWKSLQTGTIIPKSEEYHYLPDFYEQTNTDVIFEFAHEHIWESIYKLQSPDKKFRHNELLATYYLETVDSFSSKDKIFDCANYIYKSSDPFLKSNRSSTFGMLSIAGKNAMQNNAFQLAHNYLKKAISLIASDANLDAHTELLSKWVEASYYVKSEEEFEANYKKADGMLSNPINQAKLAKMKVICLTASTKYLEAKNLTEVMLRRLGSPFPKNPGLIRLIFELIQTPFGRMTKIDDLPLMTDEKSIVIQELLSETSPAYLFISPFKYAIMTYRMIRRTFKEGLSPDSGLALSFGMLTTGILRTPVKAQLIFTKIKHLLRSNKMDSVEPVLLFVEAMVVQHWFESYDNTLKTAEAGEQASVKQGNLNYMAWNIYLQSMILSYGGLNQEQLLDKVINGVNFTKQYKLFAIIQKYHSKLMEIRALTGRIDYSNDWNFEDFKENDYIERNSAEGGDAAALFGWYVSKGTVYAYMGEFDEACDYFVLADQSKSSVENTIFHTWLKQIVVMIMPFTKKHEKWSKKVYKTLKANAKGGSPEMNLALTVHDALEKNVVIDIEAEITEAVQKDVFSQNITMQAFVYFLLAEKIAPIEPIKASIYHTKASELWTINGAPVPAKNALQKGNLLSDKNQKDYTILTSIGSGRFDFRQLDVATLIKSGEVILSEIRLEPLLEKLMHYCIENAGARIGYFILKQNNEWIIELKAEAGTDRKSLNIKQKLKGNNYISESIIAECEKSNKSVLINDAVSTLPYSSDTIIRRNQTHSILCIPLIHQNRISGFIYLENNLMLNAFQQDRIGIITLLSGQISMAIENALLYLDMENQVALRTEQLREEKQKSDKLLTNILPDEVAEELKNFGKAKARKFDDVTVMFTDFKNFSGISKNLTPEQLVSDIDTYFSAFDQIIEKHGLEKIKTIGDAYMCAGGLPVADKDHAHKIVLAAIDMQKFVQSEAEKRKKLGKTWYELRIGINSGPVVAGIVGTRKFAYDIWGDSVNIAARMESSGEAGKINISEYTAQYLNDAFTLEARGKVPVKNIGELFMYYLAE